MVDEIEKMLLYIVTHQHRNLTLNVNPIVHSHLTKGWFFNSIKYKWNKKFKTKIDIVANTNYHITEFHFYDQHEEEIKI